MIPHDGLFEDYKVGLGAQGRFDLLVGRFTSTSLDIGVRRWSSSGRSYQRRDGIKALEIRRIGIIQRGYLPLKSFAPYLGIGLLWQKDRTVSDKFKTRFDDDFEYGLTALIGVEFPPQKSKLQVDFFCRVEADGSDGDSMMTMLCFGANLLFRML